MKEVKLQPPENNKLLTQIRAMFRTFQGVGGEQPVEFNFADVEFAYPALILPIAAHIYSTDSTYSKVSDEGVSSYLQTISFPEGVEKVGDLEKEVRSDRTYIPISVLCEEKAKSAERLEELFSQLVYRQLNPKVSSKQAVYYPIGELVTNIFEHSQSDRGFLFGQYYSKNECLDICILDRGIGIAASYEKRKEVSLDDTAAIERALQGESTKDEEGERGYGLWTSKQMVCEGLGGDFALISNKALYYAKKDNEKSAELPDFNWPGVVISYRIPRPTEPIDHTKYIE